MRVRAGPPSHGPERNLGALRDARRPAHPGSLRHGHRPPCRSAGAAGRR